MCFPHYELLDQPKSKANLFKIISTKNYEDMLSNSYLYFNRVDMYDDDKRDSDLPYQDREIRKKIVFEKNPNTNFYDAIDKRVRPRTFACCFSIRETHYMWREYSDNVNNSVCLVFDYQKLFKYLEDTYPTSCFLDEDNIRRDQFYINCGMVNYIDYDTGLTQNGEPHRNLYEYAFNKDQGYHKEKEFRIALQPKPLGKHTNEHNTPGFIQLSCDYDVMVREGVILGVKNYRGILCRKFIQLLKELPSVLRNKF